MAATRAGPGEGGWSAVSDTTGAGTCNNCIGSRDAHEDGSLPKICACCVATLGEDIAKTGVTECPSCRIVGAAPLPFSARVSGASIGSVPSKAVGDATVDMEVSPPSPSPDQVAAVPGAPMGSGVDTLGRTARASAASRVHAMSANKCDGRLSML